MNNVIMAKQDDWFQIQHIYLVSGCIDRSNTASLPEQKYPLSAYSDLVFLRNGSNRSIGIGKRVVELLSAETSLRV